MTRGKFGVRSGMSMIDYHAYLLRAVQAASTDDERARRAVYLRAWQLVTDQLRARQPPVTDDELRAHRSAIQAAIARIEREYSAAQEARAVDQASADPTFEADQHEPPPPVRSRRGLWAACIAAVVIAAIAAGGYTAWTSLTTSGRKAASAIERATGAGNEPTFRRRHIVSTTVSDVDPGVDGRSTDADLSLIFRRQRVFYRTTLAPGTIVVDKLQHFAYLVMPQSSALRYGIGVGAACATLSGLRRIAAMAEWPEWRPPAGSKFNRGEVMPGGPGNPLGARVLTLDDDRSRIHGTNAPKTIGEDVERGCVRLVNDDVADLYNRVSLGTGVVMR